MTPTQEQISNAIALKDNQRYVIKALAGTGKSTNVRFIGNMYPERNFLVITFSKANADESNAHKDKPSNVHYCTVNSIAFRTIVAPEFKYQINGFLNFYDMNIMPKDLKDFARRNFKTSDKEKRTRNLFQEIIASSITRFCQSGFNDAETGLDFYVKTFIKNKTLLTEENGIFTPVVTFNDDDYHYLKKKTIAYWNKLIDSNNDVGIIHDVYLKMFDLDNVIIDYFNGVKIDTIIVDEAQDSNGVILSIFERQNHLQQVMLGDKNQTIYSWRGAKNAMKDAVGDNVGCLTNSFRFNQEVANKANVILKLLDSDIFLTGLSTRTEIKTKAFLSRTNIGVLEYVLNQTDKVYVTIDFTPLKNDLRFLDDIKHNRVPRKMPKKFQFMTELSEYDELVKVYTDLQVLDRLYKYLNENYGGIEYALNKLDLLIEKNPAKCDKIATTIHKSKGLEWDEVTISGDFIPNSVSNIKQLDENGGEIYLNRTEKIMIYFSENPEQLRLLYVAITRAKVIVHTPSELDFIFNPSAPLFLSALSQIQNPQA